MIAPVFVKILLYSYCLMYTKNIQGQFNTLQYIKLLTNYIEYINNVYKFQQHMIVTLFLFHAITFYSGDIAVIIFLEWGK